MKRERRLIFSMPDPWNWKKMRGVNLSIEMGNCKGQAFSSDKLS